MTDPFVFWYMKGSFFDIPVKMYFFLLGFNVENHVTSINYLYLHSENTINISLNAEWICMNGYTSLLSAKIGK